MQKPAAKRRAARIAVFGAGVAFLVVVGPLVFFHLVEGVAPAKLQLPAAGETVTPGPLSGTWKVGSGSVAGYRVQEILFGQSHTAVGRTSKVAGELVISGTTVRAAEFVVDMASVRSDQRSRDVQFEGYIMETYRYRDATFRLTEPVALGSIPPPGQPVQVRVTGDLTLRGVTRLVSFTVSAERAGSGIDVNAEIPVVFSRWGIPNPSFAIAKVGDRGTVEVLLHLVRA